MIIFVTRTNSAASFIYICKACMREEKDSRSGISGIAISLQWYTCNRINYKQDLNSEQERDIRRHIRYNLRASSSCTYGGIDRVALHIVGEVGVRDKTLRAAIIGHPCAATCKYLYPSSRDRYASLERHEPVLHMRQCNAVQIASLRDGEGVLKPVILNGLRKRENVTFCRSVEHYRIN